MASGSRGGVFCQAGTWGSSATKKLYMCRATNRGRGGLPGDDPHDVLTVEVPRLAQERLFGVVVVGRVIDERRLVLPVGVARDGVGHGPAGEGAGGFLDIVLGIVGVAVHADAQGEEFQQFPAPVLVDGVLVAHAVVQVEHHGRVHGQAHEQFLEVAEPQGAEHVELNVLLLGVLALGVARAEDVVPEQGDLLFKRPLGVDHPVGPLFLLTLETGLGNPLGLIAHQDVILNGWLGFRIQQLFDRGLVALGGAGLQFLIRGAKPGAAHKVRHQSNVLFCHSVTS